MKKILPIVLICLLAGCLSEEDKMPEQDYTSFTFVHHTSEVLVNTTIGYVHNSGLCTILAKLGDIKPGVETKEVIVEDETIKEIYSFYELPESEIFIVPTAYKADTTFILKRYQKNKFALSGSATFIPVDPNNYSDYPH